MGTNNPMFVNYHTEKVEYQDRGAGHIHGTLWLKLEMIERLIQLENWQLALDKKRNLVSTEHEIKPSLEDNKRKCEKNEIRPFKGIISAFKKLKNNQRLIEEGMHWKTSLMNLQQYQLMKML